MTQRILLSCTGIALIALLAGTQVFLSNQESSLAKLSSPASKILPESDHAVASGAAWRQLRLRESLRRQQRVLALQLKRNPSPTPQPIVRTQPNPTPRPRIHPAVQKNDIRPIDQQMASEVIYALPNQCASALKHFYVRYQPSEQRGLAGKSTLIVSGLIASEPESLSHANLQANLVGKSVAKQKVPSLVGSRTEWRALMVHEFSHVMDLGCLRGTADTGINQQFKDGSDRFYNDDPSLDFYRISWQAEKTQKAGTKNSDFVTGYASWDAFEDFSETAVFWFLHREVFAQRAQTNQALAAKYAWFQKHFGNHPTLGSSLYTWDGGIPWDATKLPYIWTATPSVL